MTFTSEIRLEKKPSHQIEKYIVYNRIGNENQIKWKQKLVKILSKYHWKFTKCNALFIIQLCDEPADAVEIC